MYVQNLRKFSSWVPRDCEELRARHVLPQRKTEDPAGPKGGGGALQGLNWACNWSTFYRQPSGLTP